MAYEDYLNLWRPKRLPYPSQYNNSTQMEGMPVISELDPTARMGVRFGGNPDSFVNNTYQPSGPSTPSTSTESGSGKDLTKFGIAAGATTLGGLYSYIAANQREKELKAKGVQDTTPAEVKEAVGASRMAAANSRVSGFTQRNNQITANQTGFNTNAARTATSSSQALAAMGGGQQTAERARAELAAQGLSNQSINKQLLQRNLITQGQYKAQALRDYQNSLTSLYNAKQQAIGNTVSGVASSALLAL